MGLSQLGGDLWGREIFIELKVEDLVGGFIGKAELFGVGLAIPEAGGGGLSADVFGEFEICRELVDLGFKKVPDGLKV